MSLIIIDTPIPLKTDVDGVVRVGNTRVTLDTVIIAFKEGATAEEIVSQYPSLLLADVYAVIGYGSATLNRGDQQQLENQPRITRIDTN
jgi:uncharacterized protein (DUF433 family)